MYTSTGDMDSTKDSFIAMVDESPEASPKKVARTALNGDRSVRE